jgi:tight adherence protein C
MPHDLLIPILTGLAVVFMGGSYLVTVAARRMRVQRRLDELSGETSAALQPGPDRAKQMIAGIGNMASAGKASAGLRESLAQAGYHNRSAASIYFGAKMMLMAVGLLGAAVLVVPLRMGMGGKMMLVICVGAALSFLPNLVVYTRRAKRFAEIRRHLPDAIDLLEVCVSAGMGMDAAWNSVTDEVRGVCASLADEMALTNLEIHLGTSRAEAMRHMARRTGTDELSSLVAVLVQSERFGTSILDALRTFAASMREDRSHRAQEAAEKLAVKLIFPMVLFIFPAVVVVLAGPAVIALQKALGPR